MLLLFLIGLLLGPRAITVIWWIIEPSRFSDAFSSFVWPLLGLIFLPWTTLMYVILWSFGTGVHGLDWLFFALAVVADISVYASGSRVRR